MNMNNDIENNIDEILIPDFTTDMILDMDTDYHEQIRKTRILHDFNSDNSDSEEKDVEQLYEKLRYNELINEHISNIDQLYVKLYDFNSIEIIPNNVPSTMEQITEYNHLKRSKRLFYLQEIDPIISNDRENLREVISILSDNIQTISS